VQIGFLKRITLFPYIIRFYTGHTENLKFITGGIIGALTSLVEFACTGQLYLPVISLIGGQVKGQFLLYLLSYNIMFIVPILVIVLVSSFWVSSKELSNIISRNLIPIKLLDAVLFFTLGVYMLGIL